MRRPCGIIALLTDFGYEDYYVAAVKGVILDMCRDVKIIDITHSIESFNIYQAAFTLYAAHSYFPEGTVFLVVVDPGVGSGRRAILIVSRRYFFIGPDNGVLIPAANYDGIENVYLIENAAYFRKPVSRSFHGRDIFAPIAARIACGLEPSCVGRNVDLQVLEKNIDMGLFIEKENSCVVLRVVYIDKFGNVMLSQIFRNVMSILNTDIGDELYLYRDSRAFKVKVLEVFSHGRPGDLVLYENSLYLAELAVNMGSARNLLGINIGDKVKICKG